MTVFVTCTCCRGIGYSSSWILILTYFMSSFQMGYNIVVILVSIFHFHLMNLNLPGHPRGSPTCSAIFALTFDASGWPSEKVWFKC